MLDGNEEYPIIIEDNENLCDSLEIQLLDLTRPENSDLSNDPATKVSFSPRVVAPRSYELICSAMQSCW